jgi:hypothetical protein
MAIENIMTKTNQLSNFAVCCTTPLTISVTLSHNNLIPNQEEVLISKLQAINNFFTQIHNQEKEESAIPILTLVHDLEARLWGPTSHLIATNSNNNEDSNAILHSPFADCDFSRCQRLLLQMVETTGSLLDTNYFLVLDDRSEKDSTAVIVHVEEGVVRRVRVAYPFASRYLSAASIGHPSLDELIEIAEEEDDGVLRD